MVRAIAYIRVSTDRQATDGTSLTTQRRRVVEYIAAKGYQLLRQFVEEGESAKTDNRPVLQEMLAYCRQNRGRIDRLVFPKIDRFARYSEDYHHLKRCLRDLGIAVESIDERFDDSPAGRFLESMLAATAQFDNDVRSERTYNGMKEAVSQGRWVWKAPIGYRNVRIDGKANIEPDPVIAPKIVGVFERLADGQMSVNEVRLWLNDQGIAMGRTSLYSLVHHKVYIGQIEAFGLKLRAAVPLVPLVSRSLFLRAQEALQPRNVPKTYRRQNEDFPLRGTLLCKCGQALTASWSQGRNRRYPYYRCKKCIGVNYRREDLEAAFVAFLAQLPEYLGIDDGLIEVLKERASKDQVELVERRERLVQEQDRLKQLRQTLLLKVLNGVVPDSIAKEQLAEFEHRLAEIEDRLAMDEASPVEPPAEVLVTYAKEFLHQVEEKWFQGSLTVKKQLQSCLFPAGAVVTRTNESRTAQTPSFPGSDDSPTSDFPLWWPTATNRRTKFQFRIQGHSDATKVELLRQIARGYTR